MSRRFAVVNLAMGSLAGVDNAIRGMAKGARAAGLPIDIVMLVPEETRTDSDIRCISYGAWGRAQRLQKLLRFRAIAQAPLDRYDVVFLRYPVALDLDPLVLFRHPIAERIATIHHSNELRELWSGRRTFGNAGRVLLEWAGGRRVLSRVNGIIGVTDEIRFLQLARAGRDGRSKPSTVISNGVDVASIPFTRFAPFDGVRLRIAVVLSSLAPWHGWDRLMAAVAAHRGRVQVVVDAVGAFGREPGSVDRLPSAEIRYHGLLRKEAMSAILEEANVAVSSLAMHRAGLVQGCVLKTREYTARGLPFVYAYEDVDLGAADPFCLRLEGGEGPVVLDALIDFAARVAKMPEVSNTARDTAQARLDWSVKMRRFEEFGVRLLEGQKADLRHARAS